MFFFDICDKHENRRVAAIVDVSLFWAVATELRAFFLYFITNSGEIRFFIFIWSGYRAFCIF
jgi:hypothetical protein